jgi:hypothetical protein
MMFRRILKSSRLGFPYGAGTYRDRGTIGRVVRFSGEGVGSGGVEDLGLAALARESPRLPVHIGVNLGV